jgi:hypothetical protein
MPKHKGKDNRPLRSKLYITPGRYEEEREVLILLAKELVNQMSKEELLSFMHVTTLKLPHEDKVLVEAYFQQRIEIY